MRTPSTPLRLSNLFLLKPRCQPEFWVIASVVMWSSTRRCLIAPSSLYRCRSPLTSSALARGCAGSYRTLSSTQGFRVGFIGLGNMGLPMALNLAKVKGNVVYAFDTNPASRATAQGHERVEIVDSVAAIAAQADGLDAIFTMLPNCAAVDTVMGQIREGYGGKLSPQSPCIVDCSTVSVATSRHWHEIWASAGDCRHYDAPVSGGVVGAAAGTLTFMVGGGNPNDEAVESTVRPLLQMMGPHIFWCGGPGAGSATKLCNNLALAAQMVGICEAMNLGEGLGVDPVVLARVMNVSTAACWSSKVNNPHPAVASTVKNALGEGSPAAREYRGGFGAKLMLKDLGLAVEAAEKCGISMPLTSTTKALYTSATANGFGDKDFGVMLEYLKTTKAS